MYGMHSSPACHHSKEVRVGSPLTRIFISARPLSVAASGSTPLFLYFASSFPKAFHVPQASPASVWADRVGWRPGAGQRDVKSGAMRRRRVGPVPMPLTSSFPRQGLRPPPRSTRCILQCECKRVNGRTRLRAHLTALFRCYIALPVLDDFTIAPVALSDVVASGGRVDGARDPDEGRALWSRGQLGRAGRTAGTKPMAVDRRCSALPPHCTRLDRASAIRTYIAPDHYITAVQSIIKHAGDRFTPKLLLCYNTWLRWLIERGPAAERRNLIIEAEEAEVGCEVHFWRYADHVKKTHSLVPPELSNTFEKSLRELLSPKTISERFDSVILALEATFPAIKNWVGWWERRSIASMIFPGESAVDPALAAKVPSTSNPIENQHSLLHHAVGKDHELLPGIEKIWLHVREVEKNSNAIKEGHFKAREVRNRRPKKPPVWEENDGRAPDTVAALAAADGLTDIVGSPPPSAPPQIPPPAAVAYPPRLLKSYQWDAPNSCFFATGLELWFRSFARWPQTDQAAFLAVLPLNSALATIFRHF
ncbi:hypothetical protein B0H17DRAFT_1151812 [Mycena rosella]|uniref:Uncharacterized protein n=1 Tax=Mycena rosella TaxID=1033263 RepID=A0AAD7BI99_MYCRO|nr:hypothetical protein B0H17DRAFT_1151812 [Mycena rosella]